MKPIFACLLFCFALAQGSRAESLVDFSKVSRVIQKEPAYVSASPLYYLLLFGPKADVPVWAILDSTDSKAHYDILYLDLNGDGDLTAPGEKFSAKVQRGTGILRNDFLIGDFVEPKTGRKHTGFRASWTPDRVSFAMGWLGGPVTMGPYPTDTSHYKNFVHSAKEAPIYVPGHDQPFQFQHWISGTLQIGGNSEFKVFMGNFGSTSNGFFCVDDKFLPPAEYVVATLLYKDKSGEERRLTQDLKSRC